MTKQTKQSRSKFDRPLVPNSHRAGPQWERESVLF